MAPCQDGLQHREEDLGFIFFIKHIGHLLLTLLNKYFQKIFNHTLSLTLFHLCGLFINFNKIYITSPFVSKKIVLINSLVL